VRPGRAHRFVQDAVGQAKIELDGGVACATGLDGRLRRRLPKVFPARGAGEAVLAELLGGVAGRRGSEELRIGR
jgi:hypothetical protein